MFRARPLQCGDCRRFRTSILKTPFPASATPVVILALLAIVALASPARADRCDDLAHQLAAQIGGLTVGRTIANTIALSHPAARTMRLGCSSRNVSNEVSASVESRKPAPAFYDVVASAAALTFTIPKKDTLKGAARCIGRLGILRGYDLKTRYRQLDIHCSRTRTGTTIAISRQRDQ